MRSEVIAQKVIDEIYENGRATRRAKYPRHSCPYGDGQAVHKGWWLAGWMDQDIEWNVRVSEVAATKQHRNAPWEA